jgi:hypothetical protein
LILALSICILDQGETFKIGPVMDLLAAPANSRVSIALDLPNAEEAGPRMPSPMRNAISGPANEGSFGRELCCLGLLADMD